MSASPVFDLPRRFALTVPMTDRRVTCPQGHVFTPDATLVVGRHSVRCRQCQGDGEVLLIAVLREFRVKLIVQVTREELATLSDVHARPGVDLLWLVLQPLGSARFQT